MKRYKITLDSKRETKGVKDPVAYVNAENQEEADILAVKKTLLFIGNLIVKEIK